MLFTVFELDDVTVMEVVTVISKAFLYFVKSTACKPRAALIEVLNFVGFDTSYYLKAWNG